jgi:hypothetical protein
MLRVYRRRRRAPTSQTGYRRRGYAAHRHQDNNTMHYHLRPRRPLGCQGHRAGLTLLVRCMITQSKKKRPQRGRAEAVVGGGRPSDALQTPFQTPFKRASHALLFLQTPFRRPSHTSPIPPYARALPPGRDARAQQGGGKSRLGRQRGTNRSGTRREQKRKTPLGYHRRKQQ